MARDARLRAGVERLLRGDFHAEDLYELFLSLRDRSNGAESVREIGDFVAHPRERDKGLVTNKARLFFQTLRFQMPFIGTSGPVSYLPSGFADVARNNLAHLPEAAIKSNTGLKRKAAAPLLASAISKFSTDSTGQGYLVADLSDEEKSVLEFLLSALGTKSAFTDDGLYREFCCVLCKNSLLSTAEKKLLSRARSYITLYTLAHMHQVDVALDDGSKAHLFLHISDGLLSMCAEAECVGPGGVPLSISGEMFSTNLRPIDWCEANVIAGLITDQLGPIEVTSDPKLVLI